MGERRTPAARPPRGTGSSSRSAPSPSRAGDTRSAGSGRPGGSPGSHGPRPAEPGLDSQAAFKGLLIAAITVVVGAFVFVQGLPGDDDLDTVASPSTVGALSTTTVATTVPTTRTPETKVAPAKLDIAVANAVDKARPIAATVSSRLNAAGYTKVSRLDAKPSERSAVYFASPEWREDAVAVAIELGIPETDVAPLPNPSPVPAKTKATVVVLVGREPRALIEGATSTTKGD